MGIANQFVDIAKDDVTLLFRVISAPWAALVTEIVSHLLIMSLLVWAIKSKWISIVKSSALFVVLFHMQGVEGNTTMTIYLIAGNFVGASLSGWYFWKRGFMAAVTCHAFMHLFIVSIN